MTRRRPYTQQRNIEMTMENALRWNRLRYSAYAPVYDLLAAPFVAGRRRAIDLLQIQSGERVLILGCGTGLDLPWLPSESSITAIDLTPAMIRRTAERAKQCGMTVSSAVMNGEQLALPSATYDVVLLHLVLAVVPDPIACAREAARVLRPGGRVSIFDKFLPDAVLPSPARRVVNVVTGVLFSEINRHLGPILTAAGLTIEHVEPVGLGGNYQAVLATKCVEGEEPIRLL